MTEARATIRVDLDGSGVDPAIVAAALAPDDTPEIEHRVDGTVLETRVERGSVGGLRSTIDDYVVNLGVAMRVAERVGGVKGATDMNGVE